MKKHLYFISCVQTFAFILIWPAAIIAEPPTENVPTYQIRFNTPKEASAKRHSLIQYIWSANLPKTLPQVTQQHRFPEELVQIDNSLVEKVDRLDINVSNWGFYARTYMLNPKRLTHANRLVIVHLGHGDDLSLGQAQTINRLLAHGFSVVPMAMPLSGWNTDQDGILGDNSAFRFLGRGAMDHGQMFRHLANTLDGGMYRFFLEPVVQVVNYFFDSNQQASDVSMIGLSGGGWTTSMAAAIDQRITLSIPVAGSAPLYVRNNNPSWPDDTEQTYEPLYSEDIAPDGTGGGVATWLEIYALGGFGNGRRQIMVINEFDSCCFSGRFVDDLEPFISNRVSHDLGQGVWEYVLDSSHNQHKISQYVIENVLIPALGLSTKTLGK